MLKGIVGCLALANIFYFLWAHGVGQVEESAASPEVAQTLKLVGEVPESGLTSPLDKGGLTESSIESGEGSAPDPGGAAQAPGFKRCISVGPFHDVAEAAHAATTLRASGYDPRQRVVDGEVWAGVWVYLPAPGGPAGNDQLIAKLKAAGIDDALLMPGPVDGSVISLGLFSEPKRAQARMDQATALGLSPGVAERKRTGNVYWVDVDLKPTDRALNAANLQGEGRIARLETKTCPAGAAP